MDFHEDEHERAAASAKPAAQGGCHSGIVGSIQGTRGGPEMRRGLPEVWLVVSSATAKFTAGVPLLLPQGFSLWEVQDMASGDVFVL